MASFIFQKTVSSSVQIICFPFDIFPTRCNITQFIYFWKTALHVLGGISTHHQKHTQLYLQYLVLMVWKLYLTVLVRLQQHQNRSVQFPHHTQTSSNSSTIAAGSSNGLTRTRYCKYSCVCS